MPQQTHQVHARNTESLPPMEPEEFLQLYLDISSKKLNLLKKKWGYREFVANILVEILNVPLGTARDWGKNDLTFSKMPEYQKVNLAYRWYFINQKRLTEAKIERLKNRNRQAAR